MHDHKNLIEIHEDVPAVHYDVGLKRNLFQKYWHSRRFAEVLRLVKPVNGAVLDIGCHSGTFTEKILKKVGSKNIFGVDISRSAIDLIKKRIPYGKFQVANAEKLPFAASYFEAVYCLEMLEHVDDPEAVLLEIKRVLKKGGYALILVPTESKLFKFVWFFWTLYYPMWKHAHVQSFDQNKLENYLQKIGFEIISVKNFNLKMLKIVYCKKI